MIEAVRGDQVETTDGREVWTDQLSGLPFTKWEYGSGWTFLTPCCLNAASISDGPMYCKKCYAEVAELCGTGPDVVHERGRLRHPQVRKMLDLSIRHLPYELGIDGLKAEEAVTVYELDYGWMLWVPDDPEESAKWPPAPPPLLQRILLYARSVDCDYVLLDRDAPSNANLPVYEW